MLILYCKREISDQNAFLIYIYICMCGFKILDIYVCQANQFQCFLTTGLYLLFGTYYGMICTCYIVYGIWIAFSVVLYGVCCKNFAFDLQFKLLKKSERERIVREFFGN